MNISLQTAIFAYYLLVYQMLPISNVVHPISSGETEKSWDDYLIDFSTLYEKIMATNSGLIFNTNTLAKYKFTLVLKIKINKNKRIMTKTYWKFYAEKLNSVEYIQQFLKYPIKYTQFSNYMYLISIN